MCVDACEDDEWFDTATNRCRRCKESGTEMAYCIKCNGMDSC